MSKHGENPRPHVGTSDIHSTDISDSMSPVGDMFFSSGTENWESSALFIRLRTRCGRLSSLPPPQYVRSEHDDEIVESTTLAGCNGSNRFSA